MDEILGVDVLNTTDLKRTCKEESGGTVRSHSRVKDISLRTLIS